MTEQIDRNTSTYPPYLRFNGCFDHKSKRLSPVVVLTFPTWSAAFQNKKGNRIYYVMPEPRIKSDFMSDAAALFNSKKHSHSDTFVMVIKHKSSGVAL